MDGLIVVVEGKPPRLDSAKACFTRFSRMPTRSFNAEFSKRSMAEVPSGTGKSGRTWRGTGVSPLSLAFSTSRCDKRALR